MKSIKYLIILAMSLFALQSYAQGYKIILKDGRTASVRNDETELMTFSNNVSTKAGTVPGYKIILSNGKTLTIGTDETEIFTFSTDKDFKTNISAFETVAVTSITLSNSTLSMTKGDKVTLTATVLPSNATDNTLTWSSNHASVATVNNDGLITAKSEGTATITATANDGSGISASCTVTVSPAVIYVSSLSINKSSLTITEGETAYLDYNISPSNATNKRVTWSSSNPNVATVNTSGEVNGISEGTATITLSTNDGSGLKSTCLVTVKPATVYVTSISLSNTSISMTEGDIRSLTATVYPSNATNTDVTWSSSNTSVATVSGTGLVTAKSAGTATITATAADGSGVKATCKITVSAATIYVTSISLNNTSLSMNEGDAQSLIATVYPTNATNRNVTWSSSNSSVATISGTGLVTAKSAGTATITATAADGSGVKATCKISVQNKDKAPSSAEAIDLGLPSGIKWANMNVGASSPDDYGNYFAWGETTGYDEGKTTFSWSTYTLCNGSSTTMLKYCIDSNFGTVDNKTVLESSDDAATANWGGAWRTPTLTEWEELKSECTWTWTCHNGVYGYEVRGTNGNSIFLPSAGYYLDNVHCGTIYDGSYWSSSLSFSINSNCAYLLSFDSREVGITFAYGRLCGQSVRPCQENPNVYVTSISLSNTSISMTEGDTRSLTATVYPSNATNTDVTWSSSNSSVATISGTGLVTAKSAGTATITATANDGSGITAICEVTVTDHSSDLHEYVDLGLSVKWATCNVGASSPEDYGMYFAWGECVQQNNNTYTWSSYKWCNGSKTTITKYCTNSFYGTVDNKTILESSDDAATVNWGGTWRMPTATEIKELKENCTWTWTSQNGVNGYKVTSNKKGYTDKSIFLPAAGDYTSGRLTAEGSFGYYWSSTLSSTSEFTYCAFYMAFWADDLIAQNGDRDPGLSVRPVCP